MHEMWGQEKIECNENFLGMKYIKKTSCAEGAKKLGVVMILIRNCAEGAKV